MKATRGLLRHGHVQGHGHGKLHSVLVVVVGCVRKINFVRKLPRERERERKAVKRDTETEIEEKGLKHNPMTFWPKDKRIKEPMLSWLIAQIQAGTRIQP